MVWASGCRVLCTITVNCLMYTKWERSCILYMRSAEWTEREVSVFRIAEWDDASDASFAASEVQGVENIREVTNFICCGSWQAV